LDSGGVGDRSPVEAGQAKKEDACRRESLSFQISAFRFSAFILHPSAFILYP
jgi:hypothetical protein